MIKHGQLPAHASLVPPPSVHVDALAGVSALAEQVRQQLTRHALSAITNKTSHGTPIRAADEAVAELVQRCRALPSQSAGAVDAALRLIALLDQITKTVRPQSHYDGTSFVVLSPQVLQDLRETTLGIVTSTLEHVRQPSKPAAPDSAVAQATLRQLMQRLTKDLRQVSAGAPGVLKSGSIKGPKSSSDSWMLSSDSVPARAIKSPDVKEAPFGPQAPGPKPQALRAPLRALAGSAAPLPAPPKLEGIAGVSVHLPYDPVPDAPVSVKIKWLKAEYSDQPFAGPQYSKLYDAQGHSFVLTPTFARGAYGKARKVYDMDKPHLDLVAKEMRHVGSRKRWKSNKARTRVTTALDAVIEANLTQKLRQEIEQDMRPYDELPLTNPDSLQRARASVMPFELHGVISNAAKTYIIMSGDIGALGQIKTQLIGTDQVFAAQSLAAQMLSELQILHETCGMAHLDLSEGNIFVARSGQFKIMDPGGATPLVGGRTEKYGVRGTLLAPENVGFAEREGVDFALTAATDVFAAAALITGFATSRRQTNIFNHSFRMPGTSTLQESAPALFSAFAAWRKAMLDPKLGRITAAKIEAGEDDVFSPFFAPLARMAPKLCETLVNHAMALNPQNRLSAGDLAHTARGLLPSQTQARDSFAQTLKALDSQEDRQEEFDYAALYHAWETQQTKGHLEKVAAQRGQPRNLPG